jgi:hypothetical protein
MRTAEEPEVAVVVLPALILHKLSVMTKRAN